MDSLLGRAIALASSSHRYQLDKRGEPYILHPLRVMNAVRAAGYEEKYQVTAVLHDLLEDTFAPAIEMDYLVGKEISEAIDYLTRRYAPLGRTDIDECGARKWGEPLETHEEYFQRCVTNPIARVVKYFDTLDNMDPKRYAPHVPYKRYLKSMQWFREQDDLLTQQLEHGIIT